MEFRGDDRGQSVQIGAVLLFGFLVIALTTYQTTVVPQQNAEIEYNHNQAVGMDMLDLRNDLLTAGRTGRPTATTVQLGTRYPARALFINPPPPSGRIETVGTNDDAVNVSIGNATADGDVGDYWNASDNAFNTGTIVYSPDYNEYQNAPDTGIDTGTGVVFNAQQDAKIPLADQQLIEEDRINLVLLTGNLSTGGSYATSLDVRPVSSSDNTIEIQSDQNVTITLATRLDVEQWEDLTSDEQTDGRVLDVQPAGLINGEFDRIRLVLEPGSYRLSMSKVGVGTVGSESGTEPAYLTAVSGDAVVNEGTEQPVRFELRDELNNPTGGSEVNISINNSSLGCVYIDDPSSCGSVANATDHDGEIDVHFRATNINGSPKFVRVTATFDDNSSAAERSQVNLTVVNTDGSGAGNGSGGGDGGNANNVPGSEGGEEYVAYNDADGDGVYDESETRYTPSQLENFNDGSADVRIADSIESNNKIQINKAKSFVVEEGASVDTSGEFQVNNNVDSVTIEGSVTSGGKMQFQQSGDFNVIGGSISSGGDLSVQIDGSIIANDATIESSGAVTLRTKTANIDLRNAVISAPGEKKAKINNGDDGTIRVNGLGVTGGNAKLIAEVKERSQVEGEDSVDPGEVEIKT